MTIDTHDLRAFAQGEEDGVRCTCCDPCECVGGELSQPLAIGRGRAQRDEAKTEPPCSGRIGERETLAFERPEEAKNRRFRQADLKRHVGEPAPLAAPRKGAQHRRGAGYGLPMVGAHERRFIQ